MIKVAIIIPMLFGGVHPCMYSFYSFLLLMGLFMCNIYISTVYVNNNAG